MQKVLLISLMSSNLVRIIIISIDICISNIFNYIYYFRYNFIDLPDNTGQTISEG